MKVAVIGSRTITKINLEEHLPKDVTLIVSGGARGVDTLAQNYAQDNGIEKLVFLPEYEKYKISAPIIRNKLIVDNADLIIAFWDGKSKGTKSAIEYAKKQNKQIKLVLSND